MLFYFVQLLFSTILFDQNVILLCSSFFPKHTSLALVSVKIGPRSNRRISPGWWLQPRLKSPALRLA
jgi:hypothetical protein